MKKLIRKVLLWLSPDLFDHLRMWRYKKIFPKPFVSHINRLNSTSLVIDIGANVGHVSELLARTGAKVIAFEPNNKAIAELRKVANRFPNIEVNAVAAGIKNEAVKLYLPKDLGESDENLTKASSLKAEKPNVSKEFVQDVNEIDLAEYLLNLDKRIDLIKIDIEGYEIELINHLLDKNALVDVEKVYLETHECKFSALIEATEKLKARIAESDSRDKFFYDWP